jgi:hypothetical protein
MAKLATWEEQAVMDAEEEEERRRAAGSPSEPCLEVLRLQAERYLRIANGLDVALQDEYVPSVYDAEQRRRAVALSEQNAAPRQVGGPVGGAKGGPTEEPGEEVAEIGGDAAIVPVDTLSDIDDEEIDSYLATDEEAAIRKDMWIACNECASGVLFAA